jgi:hypothetical protein
MKRNANKTIKPLVFAVAMTLGMGTAIAAVVTPPSGSLPGTFYGTPGTTYTASGSTGTITATSAYPVLVFGSAGASLSQLNTVTAPGGVTTNAGFSVGSGATLNIEPTGSPTGQVGFPVVLVIDRSGNPTDIDGTLNIGGSGTNIVVANGNGMLVGANGVINAPGFGFQSTVGAGANGSDTNLSDVVNTAEAGGFVNENYTAQTKAADFTLETGGQINSTGYFEILSGQGTVNIDSTIGSSSSAPSQVGISAQNVNIDAPITVQGTGSQNFFVDSSTQKTGDTFNLGSSGAIMANVVSIAGVDGNEGTGASTESTTLVTINGTVNAAGNVNIGYYPPGLSLSTTNVQLISSVTGTGSVNSPVFTVQGLTGNVNNGAGNANFMQNGFQYNVTGAVAGYGILNIGLANSAGYPDGSSAAHINIAINGNVEADSWNTNISDNAPMGGSALILNDVGSSGNNAIDVVGITFAAPSPQLVNYSASGANSLVTNSAQGNVFLFPGSVALVSNNAGGSATLNASIDTAWTTTAAPFQGVYVEAPSITAKSAIFLDPGQWVNFSTQPTGLPEVYNYTPTATNGFTPAGLAIHGNSYTQEINLAATGGNWISAVSPIAYSNNSAGVPVAINPSNGKSSATFTWGESLATSGLNVAATSTSSTTTSGTSSGSTTTTTTTSTSSGSTTTASGSGSPINTYGSGINTYG